MSFALKTSAPAPTHYRNNINEIEQELNGSELSIGIVMARFNQEISEGLLAGCCQELVRLGVTPENITLATVPGALELPLALQAMAESDLHDALVAIGCVIRGETYHFEIVSNESARGITDVQLSTGIPIANAVLTVENDAQATERMTQKGREAAQAAIEMVHLLQAVS